MYKKVFLNIVNRTSKKGLLWNNVKNHPILLLTLNNENVNNTLSTHFVQTRSIKRMYNKPRLIDKLLNEKESESTTEEEDKIASIIINKNNEEAQKKIDEFRANPENDKIYRTLELQLDWWRQENRDVPDNLRPFEILQLLQYKGTRQIKYLRYLFLNEKKKEIVQKKKEVSRESLEKFREERKLQQEDDDGSIEYSLSKNSMFLRIYPKTMNMMYNNNALKAQMFGNKIILDCSYDKFMNPSEITSCARQISRALSDNREHNRPFNMYLCNAPKSSKLMQKMHKFIPTIYEPDYPINITEKSYLDIFDKSKLCYLTPHCRTELVSFDRDTTYIIGAFVDKTEKQPISLAKAKREGIRMAKLPLEFFLDWGSGSSKNLTLNACMGVLMDIQAGNNWKEAMKHIPHRKLKQSREYVAQKRLESKMRRDQGYDNYGNEDNNREMREDNSTEVWKKEDSFDKLENIAETKEANNSANKQENNKDSKNWQQENLLKLLKEQRLLRSMQKEKFRTMPINRVKLEQDEDAFSEMDKFRKDKISFFKNNKKRNKNYNK